MAAYLVNLLISSSWPRDSLSRVLIIYINHTLPLLCLCGAPAFGVITLKDGREVARCVQITNYGRLTSSTVIVKWDLGKWRPKALFPHSIECCLPGLSVLCTAAALG